jgi:membrane fusion protein (multidrug efflux system)
MSADKQEMPAPGPTLAAVPAAAPAPAAKKGPPKPLLALLAVGAILGGGYYLYSMGYEETDDAQIDGNISNISPRVSGTIKSVEVVDNQTVKANQLLAEIDPADYQVALAEAKAQVAQADAQLRAEDPNVPIAESSNLANVKSSASDLASAQAALAGARKDQAQVLAQLAQAEANDRNAQLELQRGARLIKSAAIAQADYDTRVNAAAATAANVEALRQSLAAARDRILQAEARASSAQVRLSETRDNAPRTLAARRATVVAKQAALDLAKAQLAQAELNLAYTKILSPAAGIIGKKSVSIGDRVSPGQQLMALSEIDSLWVTANYRETQLARMKPGQPVDVFVDSIDKDLHGTVESIGGATGSRFSILPPENASGNYVKVVQRIPVRIRLDAGQAGLDRLRPGMSVEPKVHIR